MFFVEFGLALLAWLGMVETATWEDSHWECDNRIVEGAEDDEIVPCNDLAPIDLGG